jgi:HlyD family secretion protein
MKKALIVTGIIVLVGVGLVLAVKLHSKPVVTPTVSMKKRTIVERVTAVGNILPKHIITIRSALDGIVTNTYKGIGDFVKKGEALALVGPNVSPSTLAQAISLVTTQEAKVAGDKKLVANDEILIANKLVTTNYSTYVSDLSTLKQDEATLLYNKQNLGLIQYGQAVIVGKLEKGQVLSPIDGFVLQQNVDVGDSIISLSSNQSATNLFTIANMDDLVFRGEVDELDADKLKLNMKATVDVGPLEGKSITGTLTGLGLQSNEENEKYSSSSSSSSTSTNTPFNVGFQVEVEKLIIPKGVTLRSGFSATASFIVKTYKDVLTLPQSVVHFTATSASVMVFQGEKIPAKKVIVKTGGSDGSYVQILSGLKADDKVLAVSGNDDEN